MTFVLDLQARGETAPLYASLDGHIESFGRPACAAVLPRADGANRYAIRTISSCGEGKPLPAPLPRGAPRRERTLDDRP